MEKFLLLLLMICVNSLILILGANYILEAMQLALIPYTWNTFVGGVLIVSLVGAPPI